VVNQSCWDRLARGDMRHQTESGHQWTLKHLPKPAIGAV
jgi:hypothetical protein